MYILIDDRQMCPGRGTYQGQESGGEDEVAVDSQAIRQADAGARPESSHHNEGQRHENLQRSEQEGGSENMAAG